MHLTIALPHRIFLEAAVDKIVTDGRDGSFCLEPRHIDFVSALEIGVLSYLESGGGEGFVAVDRGVLVKRGREVSVSVRRAVQEDDLDRLEATVRETYGTITETERESRRASANLEAAFVRRFLEIKERLSL
jgi:F-type H+-transporting ATPase subunit epsilon